MQNTLAAIEKALAIVQQTLDLLTSRGDDEAAFEVARAQYSASIRDSWPNNLSSLVKVLDKVYQNPKSKLDDTERAQVGEAIALLREALNQ
ncbi:MAG: hypothetical protein ACOC1F_11280 [Myxococcota bacterium]